MKSLVIAPTLHSSNWRVFCWNTCFYNFWISQVISGWNPLDFTDFMVKSARFQGEIHMKSTGFHEIHMKSARFHEIRMKSARFHTEFHEIRIKFRRISWTWAFGWWSSIGLSIERPNMQYTKQLVINLESNGRNHSCFIVMGPAFYLSSSLTFNIQSRTLNQPLIINLNHS